jgi:hypothetical protein
MHTIDDNAGFGRGNVMRSADMSKVCSEDGHRWLVDNARSSIRLVPVHKCIAALYKV